MKKLKITIIVLLVILVLVLVCILMIKPKETKFIPGESDTSQDFIKNMGLVNDYQTFFGIRKMLMSFIDKVASGDKEATYTLLDDDYIKENNITKENVFNKIAGLTKYNNVKMRQAYGQENSENAEYYIKCVLEKNHIGEEHYFAIYTDVSNYAYSIEIIDKNIYEGKIKNNNKELDKKTIERTEYNKIEKVFLTEKEIVTEYLEDYIDNALYYPEYAYSTLNAEYKSKRFPTFETFKSYIEDKREILLSYNGENRKKDVDFDNINDYYIYLSKQVKKLNIEGYQIRNEDEYTRYICKDNYGNYYIFYAVSSLNYTLVLDSYTLEIPELSQEYKEATTQEKVCMNIEKIVEALNQKDYNYVYSKLVKEFKENKFKTYEGFKKYAEETFDVENKITYNKYTESEDYCTYEITLKGKNKIITKTIVMKLEEGTDFVMSFNVK